MRSAGFVTTFPINLSKMDALSPASVLLSPSMIKSVSAFVPWVMIPLAAALPAAIWDIGASSDEVSLSGEFASAAASLLS